MASLFDASGGSSRRSQYARNALVTLLADTRTLRDSWDPNSGNFVAELALAGRGSTTYTDQKSAVQELLNGMLGIADEVANTKLAVPLTDQSTAEEESRFSNNSRRDFINNLHSINNVYEGRFDPADDTSTGVTDFVANQDPERDAQLRMAIRDAIGAVIAIPEPFGQSIIDRPDTVRAAIQAVQDLQAELEAVKALVDTASFAH